MTADRVAADATLRDALGVFARIGVLSFGGPTAQIALMHRILVEEERWLTEDDFLAGLSFCMLLPGPEAMQLATYVGWRRHGVVGGLAAGLLFVLPGALVVLALAGLYAAAGDVPLVEAAFVGVKAAVIALVVEAMIRISRRALKDGVAVTLALASFAALFLAALPYPVIVLAAAAVGFARGAPAAVAVPAARPATSAAGTARTAAVWLALWLVPLAALSAFEAGLLADLGWFFSRLAVVTFGGAYAVLAYMAQEVVALHGWLATGEMMDGLGLAETTPGPLILVTQFVGFLAAWNASGSVGFAVAGAAVALWATFVPCFLWIFVGAPYIAWLNTRARLRGALAAVTAAVVGVIASLALWFALHVLFLDVGRLTAGPLDMPWPTTPAVDLVAVALTVLGVVLLVGFKWSILVVLAASAVLGIAAEFAWPGSTGQAAG
ncbi:chromate efflux transporter [Acuticoccus sp.]|uniref:chromate efflux transporter n=1 Tax=Acuticoccus sp. TaxID=1904378 RepID=UPI003B517EB5